MDEKNPEQYQNQLKLREYDQICQDWRHRDTLLWQALAISITISGLSFSQIFNPEIKWPINFMIAIALLWINFVLLLSISKHHYYQQGSSELLQKMGQDKIIQELFANNPDRWNDNLRIWKPTESIITLNKENSRIPFPLFYFWLRKLSGFKAFFYTQLLIITLNLFFIVYIAYTFYFL